MKVFLDTSALAKRYIQEPGSEELEDFFLGSVKVVVVSTLALPEFAAALGRRVRDGEISQESAAEALSELDKDWRHLFIKIPLTEDVALSASSLAIQYPLKGADAVHLASAIASDVTLFIASDKQLLKVSATL